MEGRGSVTQLRECEYILTIAQQGNMGKAAQLLYVSQPTLSRMLSKLEESIGMPLFERQSTGMVPTAMGETYIRCARQIMELNEQLDQEIKNVTGKQPLIDVGLPMLRTEMMTRSIFPQLSKEFFGMLVHFIQPPQNKLSVDLLSNRYALGVGIIKQKFQHALNYETVGEEEYVIVVPKGHPLEMQARPVEGYRYPFIDTERLVHAPFILSRPDAYSTRFAQRFFAANKINPLIALMLPQTGMLIHAVAAGAGVAILPSLPLKALELEDRVTYLSIQDEDEEPMEIGVLYRKGYTLSKIEMRFIELLRQVYQQR